MAWRAYPDTSEIQPLLLDLVNRGIIRILDIAFVTKDEDGSVTGLELGDLKQVSAAFAEFEGASSGLLDFEDLKEAATILEPGTSAAVLVWENRWAAPVAAALRRSGGQLASRAVAAPAPRPPAAPVPGHRRAPRSGPARRPAPRLVGRVSRSSAAASASRGRGPPILRRRRARGITRTG